MVTAAEFKKTAGAIFDSTLGAAAANIDVTGISATYANLMMSIYARGDTAAATTNVSLQFNGDAASNYDWQILSGSAAASSASEVFATTGALLGAMPANTAGANLFNSVEVFIPNYAGSTNNKQTVTIHSYKSGTTSGTMGVSVIGGAWRSNAAINRVTLVPSAGNFAAGTRVTIHALGA